MSSESIRACRRPGARVASSPVFRETGPTASIPAMRPTSSAWVSRMPPREMSLLRSTRFRRVRLTSAVPALDPSAPLTASRLSVPFTVASMWNPVPFPNWLRSRFESGAHSLMKVPSPSRLKRRSLALKSSRVVLISGRPVMDPFTMPLTPLAFSRNVRSLMLKRLTVPSTFPVRSAWKEKCSRFGAKWLTVFIEKTLPGRNSPSRRTFSRKSP